MNKQIVSLYGIPAVILVFSVLITIVCIGRVSTIGSEVHAYEQKTAALKAQNTRIEHALAKEQSLTSLAREAAQKGYIPIVNLRSVEGSQGPVALQLPQ